MTKRRRLNLDIEVTRDDDQSIPGGSDDPSNAPKYQKKRKRNAPKGNSDAPRSAKSARETVHKDLNGDTHIHTSTIHVIKSPSDLQDALLEWYETVHTTRGMPWRKPYNPHLGSEERSQRAYEVWVSEIMLQQTQVATVIPYYMRWMKRYPTIQDLAAANVDEVNALWKGLGYYSRASRLLAGAQKAVSNYHGKLPDNAKDLEAYIPGIGRYSAGAIASIAYGEHVPVLDGNVHRLLSRFLALHAPPKVKATLDILWAAAAAMVESTERRESPPTEGSPSGPSKMSKYPGDINQALIELGSTICKVHDPSCDACPLRARCRAYEISRPGYKPIVDIEDVCTYCEPLHEATVTAFPMKVKRKRPREELDIVNVVEWISSTGERWFLMVRRPDGGLLGGLYEFLTSSNVPRTTSTTAQKEIPLNLLGQLFDSPVLVYKSKTEAPTDSLVITTIKPVGDVIHVFSHIKKTYRVQWVVVQGGESPPALKVDGIASSAIEMYVNEVDSSRSHQPNVAMWVRMEDVPGINMGTGVTKIWKSVQKTLEMTRNSDGTK